MPLARRLPPPTAAQQARQDGRRKTKAAKFSWDSVDIRGDDDCWPWKKGLNTWGYGVAAHGGVTSNASRAVYQIIHGNQPKDIVIRHTCDWPACCNPCHLIPGTQADNLADCRKRNRMRYKFGTEHHRSTAKLTEANIIEAKRLYPQMTQTAIAKKFGVHSSVISRAIRGESWSHL